MKQIIVLVILALLLSSCNELVDDVKFIAKEVDKIPSISKREVLEECDRYMDTREYMNQEIELRLELRCLQDYAKEVDMVQGCKLLIQERDKFTYMLFEPLGERDRINAICDEASKQ